MILIRRHRLFVLILVAIAVIVIILLIRRKPVANAPETPNTYMMPVPGVIAPPAETETEENLEGLPDVEEEFKGIDEDIEKLY